MRAYYKIQALFNLIQGYLAGTREGERVRPTEQRFICEVCEGGGETSLGKDENIPCTNCEGSGIIHLKFTVQRIYK